MNKISNNSRSGIRPLESLNVIDSFLFQEITEDEENAKFIAKLIVKRVLGVELKDITVEVEKHLNGIDTDKRGIRLDLRVTEKDLTGIAQIYNIEPNAYKENNLPHRSRYYQSLTDAKYLGSGKEFVMLPDVISIWILEHDPFGGNRIIYNVKNVIEEMPDVLYNDGVRSVFLYTKGELGGTKELKDLLKYISESNSSNVADTELETLHELVNGIKHREGIGDSYMTYGDVMDYEREIGYEQGMQQGMQQGMEILIINNIECEISDDKTIKVLQKKYNLDEEQALELIASVKAKM
ncbi:MAG: Rpn family recombination-promoting nuclease/putative transposase [Lachnospira sp.]|nr:Rpn family recombination-promoting nuclease/putative transposase [Lachnospira sp.]